MKKEQNLLNVVDSLRIRDFICIGITTAVLNVLLQFICFKFNFAMRKEFDFIIVPYNVIFLGCMLLVGIMCYIYYQQTNNIKYRNWSIILVSVLFVDAFLKLVISLKLNEIGLSKNSILLMILLGVGCLLLGRKNIFLSFVGIVLLGIYAYDVLARQAANYHDGFSGAGELFTCLVNCLLIATFYVLAFIYLTVDEVQGTKEVKMIEKERETNSSEQTMIETTDETINHVPLVLQELYAEMKRKDVQDIETWHNIDTMIKRVAVVYETYNKLSKTEQKNMEKEIVTIISHCQNEMQTYIQTEDETLKQEIRKMKHIICK